MAMPLLAHPLKKSRASLRTDLTCGWSRYLMESAADTALSVEARVVNVTQKVNWKEKQQSKAERSGTAWFHLQYDKMTISFLIDGDDDSVVDTIRKGKFTRQFEEEVLYSWETDDINLGPIIPECGDARPIVDKSKIFTAQPRALSA